MSVQAQKKILLALDGSDAALETVKYVSKIPLFQNMQLVLFNVFSKVPEYYFDLGKKPRFDQRIRDIPTLKSQHEKNLQQYMDRARRFLIEAGIPMSSVSIKIQERHTGIARDIVREAQDGYSVVAIGRRGKSQLKDLILGSIAFKLLEKLAFVPLFVVGRGPHPGKILLALDNSEGAMRAVDYVGNTFGASDFEVTMTHVIRGERRAWVEEGIAQIGPVLNMAKSHLVSCGFDVNQISTKIVSGVQSRAGVLVKEAKEGGYGTIVVGRRGLSRVQDFFMGRVSNKVIQLAEGKAVCVVS